MNLSHTAALYLICDLMFEPILRVLCLSDLWVASVSQECLGYIGSFLKQSMEQVLRRVQSRVLAQRLRHLCVSKGVGLLIASLFQVSSWLFAACLSNCVGKSSLSLVNPCICCVLCVIWAWCDGQIDSLSPPTTCSFLCLSEQWAHLKTAVQLSQGPEML